MASETPCEQALAEHVLDQIDATAGSPRKPMPSEVSVMPSWHAAR